MEQGGVESEEARRHFWMVNRGGLLHRGREDLKPEQLVYARTWAEVAEWSRTDPRRASLAEVVREVHPTILIGLSTVAGAFDGPARPGDGVGRRATDHLPVVQSDREE